MKNVKVHVILRKTLISCMLQAHPSVLADVIPFLSFGISGDIFLKEFCFHQGLTAMLWLCNMRLVSNNNYLRNVFEFMYQHDVESDHTEANNVSVHKLDVQIIKNILAVISNALKAHVMSLCTYSWHI